MRTRIGEFEQRDFVEQAYIDKIADLENQLRDKEEAHDDWIIELEKKYIKKMIW